MFDIKIPKTPNISDNLARIKGITGSPEYQANLGNAKAAGQQAVDACKAGRKAAQAFVPKKK